MSKTKIGIIDIGGGLRGIYATGIFDFLMENDIAFDYGIGISAGSANLSSYLGGQMGRNFMFYHDYSQREEYMSVKELVKHHSFLNLDYIYGTLSNSDGENPLNYKNVSANPMEWYIIATNAETGRPRYFTKSDISQDNYNILKASCAIPGVCQPVSISGIPYYDGALGDTIPVARAFEDGCDKVVLILTRPKDALRKQGKDKLLAKLIKKRYPRAALQLECRAAHYNEGIRLAKTYEAEGRLLIVAPSDICGMETLTKDQQPLEKMYEMGKEDARAIPAFIAQA